MSITTTTPSAAGTRARVQGVDILRGLVMVLMAIDHTRDYVHSAAMAFPPEDLSQTTAAIFMTRWITHFCAPVFMFCAGVGACLRLERGGTKAELSRFLWTRGLWLVLLEFTVVRAGFFFNLGLSPLFLLVLWALGMSMIALAVLIHLPYRALLAVSLAMIALHNLFDGLAPERFGTFAWLWRILHVQGLLTPGPPLVIVAYPLGAAPFLLVPPPTLGTPRNVFPPDYGWDLWVVYVVVVVLALYPACLWLSRLKARRRDRWLSYV